MLYIKKLVITDENDNVIHTIGHIKALDGLTEAIALVNLKDGISSKGRIAKKLSEIDMEFKEYFNLDGK